MAIVHVAMKSSSSAPPSAAHADYIMREGQYSRRGGVELVESSNLPEFAQSDARQFWQAADTHERANGRTYTELQIALPRELGSASRAELARSAAREFLGERFVYTMAIHSPVASDKIEQPHLHLMFSERIVDERTRVLPEELFFKRNGAKKDREWNDRTKPEEIRAKWCEMMNRAMESEGIEVRVDPRSWAEQGREDLAALVEPKELGGHGAEAVERRDEIALLREQRQELPLPHLSGAAAVQVLEREAGEQIAEIEQKLEEELSILEKLIATARQVAEAAKAALDRAAEGLRAFLDGVGEFERKADVEMARKKMEAERLEAFAKPRAPSREDLDRQLREIALARARYPDRKIQDLDEVSHREITGRVLGYTGGKEEALFERLGGVLIRLDMRGRPLLPIGKQIDYDTKARGISLRGMER